MRLIKSVLLRLAACLPLMRPVLETRHTQTPIPLGLWLKHRLSRRKFPYWPMHPASVAVDCHRIHLGIETSPGLMPGCYVQGTNGVVIGDYTQVAAGVKLISANHALTDNRAHSKTRPILIGKYCWLGANAIVLPGVCLGPSTVVGAGTVVTKSFPEGYRVIAGNPARVIRLLNPLDCTEHESQHRYIGFIRAENFDRFRRNHLEELEYEQ